MDNAKAFYDKMFGSTWESVCPSGKVCENECCISRDDPGNFFQRMFRKEEWCAESGTAAT